MSTKEKIVTAALALMATVPSSAQNNTFNEFRSQSTKEFKNAKQQMKQDVQNFKDTKTADFNNFRDGAEQQRRVHTRPAESISGDDVYYAGVAASVYGLEYENIDCQSVNLKENNRAYIATSPKGVALIYEGGNGFGATLNEAGQVDYFSVKQEKKSELSAVKDASIIELLNGLNESYGQAKFPQLTTQNKMDLSKKKVLQSQQNTSDYDHVTAEGLPYSFNEKGVRFPYDLVLVSINHLIPKTRYDSKAKMYYCGSQRGRVESALNISVTLNLQRLVMENYIYKDLNKRAQAGETLSSAEKVFQTQHLQRLEKEGIFINKDGKLQQQNPKYPPRQMSTRTNGGYINN